MRLLFCLFLGLGLCRAAVPPRVQPLPDLVRADVWQAGGKAALSEWPGALAVSWEPDNGCSERLLLRNPLPVPEGATGFSFVLGNDGSGGVFGVRLVMDDAAGQQFLYYVPPPQPLGERFSTSNPNIAGRPFRLVVRDLRQPILSPQAGATAEAAGHPSLRPPFRILGLQLNGFSRENGTRTGVYLRDFAFTRLVPDASPFYYAFDDQERFGELDPVPGLPLARLGRWGGGTLRVDWEARDAYDGQPFLAGGGTFSLKPGDAASPFPLQLGQEIPIPLRGRGTYWVRVKAAWTKPGSAAPDMIAEQEYRLTVLRGDDPAAHAPLAADQPIGGSLIRVAPGRTSLGYGADEPFSVPVTLWPSPEAASKKATYRIEARALDDNAVAASQEGAVAPGARPTQAVLDLAGRPPGAYRVRVEVAVAGKIVDRTERVVGRQGVAAAPAEIPASVIPWRDLLAGPALIYLDPFIVDAQRGDPDVRWSLIRGFLDHAGEVTKRIELPLLWKAAEPLPGVYDWSEIDREVAYAGTKGLSVLLWPQLIASEPEWLPSEYTRNRDGAAFGHNRYLFHGSRLNYWHGPGVRKAALDFLAALAEHFRGNPVVHGYFFITEHPDEAPSVGWYDGYEPETVAHFQDDVRQKWGTVDAANRRWGTSFAAWDRIGAPGADASPRFTLDWLRFRRDALGGFLVDCARTLRQADPKRLLVIYIDGVEPSQLPEFFALGCMFANGGSHDPDGGSGIYYLGRGAQGMQERTEERSVGEWGTYYPTQVDASFFAMLLGGGGDAHGKMYILTGRPFDELRPRPYSLDRFQQFIPLRQELRGTEMLPADAYVLDDEAGRLMKTRSTYWAGGESSTNRLCFQSHLLPPAVPLEMAVTGKLLLLLGSYVGTLETATIGRLADYVAAGGTLVMQADAGRSCVETPGDDWVLLKRLGFAPPAAGARPGGRLLAAPAVGDVFPAGAGPFALADTWIAPAQPGAQTLAAYPGEPERPALSSRAFGKGRVVVIWASAPLPPTVAGADGDYPFLHDLARAAGVRLYADASSPHIWTNVVKRRGEEVYYGLAYHSLWAEDSPPLDGTARWFLPPGDYRVKELVSGKVIGVRGAPALREQGLSLHLEPHALALYRMEKTDSPDERKGP